MSNKIDISTVADVIKRHKIAPAEARLILEELNLLAEQAKPEKDDEPKAKNSMFIVAAPDGGQGWVVQMGVDTLPTEILPKVIQAAHAFNASKAGRKNPVRTVGEAFEVVKRKFFKEVGVLVKTKASTYIVKTDNQIGEAPTA